MYAKMTLDTNISGEKPPDFKSIDDKMLVWNTYPGLGTIWIVLGTLFIYLQKIMVLEYLNKCSPFKISYPNPLGTHYCSQIPNYLRSKNLINRISTGIKFVFSKKTNLIACYQTSKAFTQGINLVAERGIDNTDQQSPLYLHRKMEKRIYHRL